MIQLTGYKIKEEISKGENSIILLGNRSSDNCPVVIKLLNREYPTNKELSIFKREYEIMNKIADEGIIKVYSIEKFNNRLAIIMEDIGGKSVDNFLQENKLNIAEKVLLAIQMTHSLLQIHLKNIIHKDVNPTNFIWNKEKDIVRIIDFGISTELVREAPQCINPSILEGTLNYLSPEQTGRTNRPIDYRTDLYSLGVTFYELFTGQLPFKGEDDLEILYFHIAKTPIRPKDIEPEIPAVLSDIIMKLIAKSVEDRYQSAFGVKTDLEYCLQLLEEKKEKDEFILGEKDDVGRFEISNKLYGREAEIEMVIDGFERAAAGSCEFLIVSGYSGIGKSSLVYEIRKPVTCKKGYFISGKFNQFERNIPYSGITQAFKELIKQLLAQSQHNLDDWKQKLLDALGTNGQDIVDIIPELEQIIGPQTQVVEFNPLVAQNRFLMTFREFINCFAKKEHPLVVFLDDLQWSDTSTLDLIKYILKSFNIRHLLIIGAYRDNEVQDGHPLLRLLDELKNEQQSFVLFHQLYLKPLGFFDTNQLIADTFHSLPNITEPLSNIILQKTKGNPFFITRLLSSLYAKGIFTFVADKGQWEYDIKKVEAVEISDNVVDLLVKYLESLPKETIEILKLVACIGTHFDLKNVSLISKKSIAVLGKDLWIAIEKEIVLPLNNNYRYINTLDDEMDSVGLELSFVFAHDRIRQAVYCLIPEKEKSEFHHTIGREYLKSFRTTNRMDEIFDLVNHLNISRDLIQDKIDRIELMDLNIIAGNKAMKSTAFDAALSYFETAEMTLSEEEWTDISDKYFDLLLKKANSALLSGDLLKSDNICEYLSKIARSNYEKGAVSTIKIFILVYRGKLLETISEIRKTLKLFNIYLPESAEEISQKTQEGIFKMKQFLSGKSVEDIINLPVMKDPEKLMALQLLQVAPPALQANPNLYNLTTLIMFELILTYGTSPLSCRCFIDCGNILAKTMNDYETSYKLAETAFALLSKFKAESQKPSVYFIFPYISQWRAHYQESLDYCHMAYKTGLETGDIMHATYAIAHKVHILMWVGKNLTECKEETENAIAFLKQSKVTAPLLLAEIVLYAIEKFQTIPIGCNASIQNSPKNSEADCKVDCETKLNEMMSKIKNIRNSNYIARFYLYNIYINIILGNMEEAEKWSLMKDKIDYVDVSDFPLPDSFLFRALIIIHKWGKATATEKVKMEEILSDIKEKMKFWSENCPVNFAHKYYLLSAKIAIIKNETLDNIVDFFEKAIDSIHNNDFIQIKALSNELYGEFWLGRGNETIGKVYIREAYYLYKQWGAYGKVDLLENQYSHFLITDDASMRKTIGLKGTKATTSATTQSSIDMISILKSTQAISSEMKIDKLLAFLIRIMIENAGAQRGCLLLENEADGKFYIEAVHDGKADCSQLMHITPNIQNEEMCLEIVQYVTRTRETIVIHDACSSDQWHNIAYIIEKQIKSVLCMPVFYQNRLKGVVYLENNLSDHVFTLERLETLKILSSQAAISIENARLYENMEDKVKERTTQLKNANEKLKDQSLHDPLTSLHNRRYIYEFINDQTTKYIHKKAILIDNIDKRHTSAKENIIGVFLVDIDHFKEVNDTYGHLAGDNVLITISKVLKSLIRTDDIIVRWGGEEFLIILYNTKPANLEKFSRKALEKIKDTPIKVSENEIIHKTCSIGYIEMPFDISNPELLNLEQMINISDYALYCAKENGRNRAAQFKMIKPFENKEELKKSLINLSKTTKLNEEYFKIEYIET